MTATRPRPTHRTPRTARGARTARTARTLALLLACLCPLAQGCNIVGFFGVVERERRRSSTITVEAEYEGLTGQSVAVVVDASREVYLTMPEVVATLHAAITQRLGENAGVRSVAPTDRVSRLLYNEPGLLDGTFDAVAERLGVTRLVVVQLEEFRLVEQGNPYVWDAVASGQVLVIEADSYIEDDVRLDRYVSVAFPDQASVTREELPARFVLSELVRRFSNRASWFFYDHEERYPEFQEY